MLGMLANRRSAWCLSASGITRKKGAKSNIDGDVPFNSVCFQPKIVSFKCSMLVELTLTSISPSAFIYVLYKFINDS